jgi:mannose-6-phosphate isomerase-like protein (cupin superfamily)
MLAGVARLVPSALLPCLLACARAAPATPETHVAAPARPVAGQARFVVKHDADVAVKQPAPHQGAGETTAYRYFDELTDAKLIFRKRALHAGAAIGSHALKHDEVYYVLSGRGELEVDGRRREVLPGTAVFMYEGAVVGIRQLGTEDLVLIIAYPPAAPSR